MFRFREVFLQARLRYYECSRSYSFVTKGLRSQGRLCVLPQVGPLLFVLRGESTIAQIFLVRSFKASDVMQRRPKAKIISSRRTTSPWATAPLSFRLVKIRRARSKSTPGATGIAPGSDGSQVSHHLMELNVPVTNDTQRSNLVLRTCHRQTEGIECAGLAVILHYHAERAARSTLAGEQDGVRPD